MGLVANVMVGLNNRKEGEEYKTPTHFIQPIYAHPLGDGYHERAAAEIEYLRWVGHKVIIKVKYMPNHDTPATQGELDDYLARMSNDILPHLHGGMGLSFCNEPNWLADPSKQDEGISGSWAAKVSAMGRERALESPQENGAWEYWTTPIAPWSPKYGDVPPGVRENIEASPWALYAWEYYDALDRYIPAEDWHGVMLHTYANVGADGTANGGAHEPFQDVRDGNGWRWGTNTIDTWAEVLDQTWFKDHRVAITEFNARTHGSRSIDAYVEGLLPIAVDKFKALFQDRLEAVDWFIGDTHGADLWNEETIYGEGRLRIARQDWESLQA